MFVVYQIRYTGKNVRLKSRLEYCWSSVARQGDVIWPLDIGASY